MKFYYLEISKRINFFGCVKYNEYFISKEGLEEYIKSFNENLYIEDELYISNQGTAHINNRGMIVVDE